MDMTKSDYIELSSAIGRAEGSLVMILDILQSIVKLADKKYGTKDNEIAKHILSISAALYSSSAALQDIYHLSQNLYIKKEYWKKVNEDLLAVHYN